tara:strand:- start:641 stop:1384 length:744 start_codon:yes stop_codon:yes gene_type:complete
MIRPKLYTSVWNKKEVENIYNNLDINIENEVDYAGRNIHWSQDGFEKNKQWIFDKLKTLYTNIKYHQLQGELIITPSPSPMHLDAQHANKRPFLQVVIPLKFVGASDNYKWQGLFIFKQYCVHDNPEGYEWHIIDKNPYLKRWKLKKILRSLPWSDVDGNRVKLTNKRLHSGEDFGDEKYHQVIKSKRWLDGFEIDSYFPYDIGDMLVFSPYALHCSGDFTKDNIEKKVFFRVRIYKDAKIKSGYAI